jgi:formamidopyrimidine-DNA glycosylase
MPELPEVETTRRHLAPYLVGARIVGITVARPRMLRRQEQPTDFARRLLDHKIEQLDRHGKYLLARLEDDIVWVTHLGMSGRVEVVRAIAEHRAHSQVEVALDSGYEFRLIDPRTFGFVAAYTRDELERSSLSRLGPDALTDLPRSSRLALLLEGRTAPIKALLLDQAIVAGLGNIYADEALYRARVSPLRPGGGLTFQEVVRLRRGIVTTLDAAIRHGGTSLDDLAYLLPDGRTGEFTARLAVYGREGERCRRCGSEISRQMLRQRSTHWCPQCQA